ncbi:MAG: hypothetical protein Q8P22_06145 [Chloroflexota bacterium]|nr:hypothetical protein [Chloroflexota bacterium]
MSEETIVRWVNSGYPHLRRALGFEPWFFPEGQMGTLAEKLGDGGVVSLAGSVLPAGETIAALRRAPDPAGIHAHVWEQGIGSWAPIGDAGPAIEALMAAGGWALC